MAAGGYWSYSRQSTSVKPATQDSNEPTAISVAGDAEAVKAFNISMLGLVAANGNTIYTSESGVLETSDGTLLLDGPLYYMNAETDGVYGVDLQGQICRVDGLGTISVLREAGHPTSLLVDGDGICFVEDGLRRMNRDGSGETLLAQGPVSSACLTIYSGFAYYIGAESHLYRVSLGGGEPEQVSSLPVEQFGIDTGAIYLTVAGGDGSLWRLNEDGTYTAASNSMMDIPSPRFVVSGNALYFGGENTPVYQTTLGGGSVQVVVPDSCGLFYILGDELYSLSSMPAQPVLEIQDHV